MVPIRLRTGVSPVDQFDVVIPKSHSIIPLKQLTVKVIARHSSGEDASSLKGCMAHDWNRSKEVMMDDEAPKMLIGPSGLAD